MVRTLPLAVQTLYAELLERARVDAFETAFTAEGTFAAKTVKGRRYWYFSEPTGDGRRQRYVGPETADLLARVEAHRKAHGERKDRRQLVSTLVRSGGLPQPLRPIGDVVQAMAGAGVFRLRAVLVGTVAYQTYGAVLGCRLPSALVQTGDVDIAQFPAVSAAVEDRIDLNMLDVLRTADESFRPIPTLHEPGRAHAYQAKSGVRVEFLAPNRGPDSDEPVALPALQTDALQLRFLDFLIRETEPAVLLHGSGVLVEVPLAERFAVHKLLLHGLRHEASIKAGKDLAQATVLLDAVGALRPEALRHVLDEVRARGRRWSDLLLAGLGILDPAVRDDVLRVAGMTRSLVPGLALTFDAPAMRYDAVHGVVRFDARTAREPVSCMISREALDDHFGTDGMTAAERVARALEQRPVLERLAAWKFSQWPIEKTGQVLVKTGDVEALRAQIDRMRTAIDGGASARSTRRPRKR